MNDKAKYTEVSEEQEKKNTRNKKTIFKCL